MTRTNSTGSNKAEQVAKHPEKEKTSVKHEEKEKQLQKREQKQVQKQEQKQEQIQEQQQQQQQDTRGTVSTRDDWFRPFNFAEIAEDWFRELDRISERFGFPPSLFSRRLSRDWWDDDFFGFDRHLSRWVPPAISRIMDDFDREFFREFRRPFSSPISMFGGHDSRNISEYTQKMFDELSNNKDKELSIPEPSEDLLSHNRELEDFYKRYKPKDESGSIYGKSYVSSTISRNGKSVTVSKESELAPDGTIKTKLDHKYKDNEGHDHEKHWEKCLDLKGGEQKAIKN